MYQLRFVSAIIFFILIIRSFILKINPHVFRIKHFAEIISFFFQYLTNIFNISVYNSLFSNNLLTFF